MRLFDAHYGDVLAYATRRCTGRGDAEDLAAEVFSIVWRRMADVPQGDAARLWMLGVARLAHRNLERGQRRRWRLTQRLANERSPLSEHGPHEQGLHDQHERVLQALASLNPADREILRLQLWEELTASEIAELLHLAPATVRKRAERARRRLAAVLTPTHGDQDRTSAPEARR